MTTISKHSHPQYVSDDTPEDSKGYPLREDT